MANPNQNPPRQQSQDEDLAFHPGIWQGQTNPAGLDDASVVSVASGSSQHRDGNNSNNNMGYQSQGRASTLPPRLPVNTMLPPRPPPANNVGGQNFGGNSVAAPRHPSGFANQYWGPSNSNWQSQPGPSNASSQYQLAPPPGFGGPSRNNWQSQPGSSNANNQQLAPPPGFGGSRREPLGFTSQNSGNNAMIRRPAGNVAYPRESNSRAAYPPASAQQQAGQGSNQHLSYDPNFTFSDNYRGSRESRSNYSANVPDHLNCSAFIRGLPPSCTPNMLLAHIRGCGTKVFALHINAPDARNPVHCAAKLVFFQRCGLEWLFDQIREGNFVITDENGRRYPCNAVYNNIRSAPMDVQDPRSRVLIVTGPASIISLDSLDALFKRGFYYEADQAFTIYEDANWRKIEFQFSSARCQSENGYQILQRLVSDGPEAFGV
ncbi:hypothetical protein PG991_001969 [Apiospora marii]|uniref:Uncharacterized protein n=1 Tax=Apiospora marii TaxID=335849 RepID=A0ABR1SNJ0_9PEZI